MLDNFHQEIIDREITKFMPDNDKEGNTFFLGNKHEKQTRYAIPTLSGNWRTQPHNDGTLFTQPVQPQRRA